MMKALMMKERTNHLFISTKSSCQLLICTCCSLMLLIPLLSFGQSDTRYEKNDQDTGGFRQTTKAKKFGDLQGEIDVLKRLLKQSDIDLSQSRLELEQSRVKVEDLEIEIQNKNDLLKKNNVSPEELNRALEDSADARRQLKSMSIEFEESEVRLKKLEEQLDESSSIRDYNKSLIAALKKDLAEQSEKLQELRTDSAGIETELKDANACLLYTSPSPRDS